MLDTLNAAVTSILALTTTLLSARVLGQWGRLRHIEQLSDAAKKLQDGPSRTRIEARANAESDALVEKLEKRSTPGLRLAKWIVGLWLVCFLILGAVIGWRKPESGVPQSFVWAHVYMELVTGLQRDYNMPRNEAIVVEAVFLLLALLVALAIEIVIWACLK